MGSIIFIIAFYVFIVSMTSMLYVQILRPVLNIGGYYDKIWFVFLWPIFGNTKWMEDVEDSLKISEIPRVKKYIKEGAEYKYIGGKYCEFILFSPDQWVYINLSDGELSITSPDKVRIFKHNIDIEAK